jgi:hypothetical protein
MNRRRLIAAISVALLAAYGAHLAPFLLAAAAVVIGATILVLAERIISVAWCTGPRFVPARIAATA